VFGLLRGQPSIPPSVDYEFLIDEWEETPDQVKTAHLLVIGTGEVNILV
jgi:hypothetical protein